MSGIPADVCGIHHVQAHDCYRLHNPTAFRNPDPDAFDYRDDALDRVDAFDPEAPAGSLIMAQEEPDEVLVDEFVSPPDDGVEGKRGAE